MKKKFSTKDYQGKERIYRAVPGATMIARLLIWDAEKKEYRSPERGKIFDARRWEPTLMGGKRLHKAYFETLEEARAWQAHLPDAVPQKNPLFASASAEEKESLGPTFGDVVAEFRERGFPLRARGTCLQYDKMLRLHFAVLMPIPVRHLTPKVVDEWLWNMKREARNSPRSSQRLGFEKEIDLLQVVVRFYEKYNGDASFRSPIKQRHREDMWLARPEAKRDRDLPREQFELVRAKVREMYGDMWWALFTVQWCAALRISEAAALHWEDVHLNWREPAKSQITVCRHAEWPRVKGVASRVTPGFKNSKAAGGKKVLPLFPEAFEALKILYHLGAKGLVFKDKYGGLLEYRHIQWRYEQAFRGLGIEYMGTHALRHGGCRDLFNSTGGDLAMAGHLLGNEDSETVKTYAKRDRSALFKVNEARWASREVEAHKVGQ